VESSAKPPFPYVRPPELAGRAPRRARVIVVGAGPVGLTLAIDLALRGVPVLVLEEDQTLSPGSRAICWSKRTLEIFDRLGIARRIVARGITWNRGKVFFRDRAVYVFDLLAEGGHQFPAFVNLQQYLVEEMLAERVRELPAIEVRGGSRVIGVDANEQGVRVSVATADGDYSLEADYLVAADGVRSAVRRLLGLGFEGQVFNDRFLIADVKMKAEFPTERWFWFDPPFHPGGSALLHRQADDVWRIDLQLGADADPETERRPERVEPRIRAMLGPDADFDLEWVSVYTFQCRRLARFVHRRVVFAGDSAHTVSPFGARGGNGGIQDVDNLGWKLARVVAGRAGAELLASYDEERIPAADENILASTRSTDFITPKNDASRIYRDAVLALAREHTFARRLVNSGRLSTPHVTVSSSLGTPDRDAFAGALAPGAPAADAPVERAGGHGWLLESLGGEFTILHYGDAPIGRSLDSRCEERSIPIVKIGERSELRDVEGLVAARYDARPGSTYLFRPDQHLVARWRAFDPVAIEHAIRVANAKR
jgi:3-(3-hydroxy-phenyl)propionate hydroxylase